ncbi:MAG: PQQ-binding-like beta-propeller repeat protein [Planctomycetes bacterium]|nr:PQQ-binding-like beta-propeller repeat protein [Planctomycetota bacterium]
MVRALVLLGLVALVLGPGAAAAGPPADWPQWRGPNRDGVSAETGLLAEWPPEGPPLEWKISGLGDGYSSVAIVGRRLYTMGDRDGAQFVLCFDLDTRWGAWAARVGESWYDGTRCTPTVCDGLVYAIGTHGDLVCVRDADARVLWRKSFKKDFGGRMMSAWGFSESPLVDGDKVVCTPGGPGAAIVALDRRTGATLWKTALPDVGPKGDDGAGYASMVVAEAAGIRQYVQLMGRGLVGVAADDGRFLWGYNRIANASANIPTPIVRGEYVFCSTAYSTGSVLVRLVAAGDGGVKAEEVYFLDADTFQNHHGGLVLVGDYLYGGHGFNAGLPVCLEFLTGRVAWRAPKAPGYGSAAVTYADGRVIFRYDQSSVALVEATPEAYRLAGTFKVPVRNGPAWAHPVVHDGRLYLRDNNDLLCYDIRKK